MCWVLGAGCGSRGWVLGMAPGAGCWVWLQGLAAECSSRGWVLGAKYSSRVWVLGVGCGSRGWGFVAREAQSGPSSTCLMASAPPPQQRQEAVSLWPLFARQPRAGGWAARPMTILGSWCAPRCPDSAA